MKNKKKHILILDDDKHLLFAIKRVLIAEGYEIETAENIKRCKEILQEQTPDLLILDVFLPDGNGLDLVEEISTFEQYSTLAILLMSGKKNAEEETKHARDLGALDYVTKPVDLKSLVQRVRLIFAVSDLQERKAKIEENYDHLFSNTSDLIFILDSSGNFQKISNSFNEITKHPVNSWLHKPFKELLHKEDQAKWDYHFKLARKNEIQPSFELRLHAADGGFVAVSMVVSTIHREAADQNEYIVVAKDISLIKFVETTGGQNDDAQSDLRERELQSWRKMSENASPITGGVYETSVFTLKNEKLFLSLLDDYGQIIEAAIQSRIYKLDDARAVVRKAFSERLGFLKAGPKDLVRIHSTFFKELDQNVHPKRLALYHEEARLALLEIMGYLVAYYRNRSIKNV